MSVTAALSVRCSMARITFFGFSIGRESTARRMTVGENAWPVAAVGRAAARWDARSAGCEAGSGTERSKPGPAPCRADPPDPPAVFDPESPPLDAPPGPARRAIVVHKCFINRAFGRAGLAKEASEPRMGGVTPTDL